MTSVLCLSTSDVASVLTLEKCIPVVEEAFASYSRCESQVFPVVRESVPGGTGIFGIKSGFLAGENRLGLKAGGFWTDNRRLGLPAHQSIILLFDPCTGVVQAMVDANVITMLRTGAVGAIACRYLAPPGARNVAVIGCGVQGAIQTRALAWALPDLELVAYYDLSEASVASYLEEIADLAIDTRRAETVEDAVDGADVIVTTTPSWEPLIEDAWVKDTAHISAIGADTKGKQELDPELFRRARLVVDDWAQARRIGESQHAFGLGWIPEDSGFDELGQLCAGMKSGRLNSTGLTIFDATGIALQDLAAAGLAVDLALEQGVGAYINI